MIVLDPAMARAAITTGDRRGQGTLTGELLHLLVLLILVLIGKAVTIAVMIMTVEIDLETIKGTTKISELNLRKEVIVGKIGLRAEGDLTVLSASNGLHRRQHRLPRNPELTLQMNLQVGTTIIVADLRYHARTGHLGVTQAPGANTYIGIQGTFVRILMSKTLQ